MNDFTKEELKQIREGMDDVYRVESCPDLMIKVQSLIDNYCEHENDIRFNALPESGSVKMCKICQRFYV